MIDQDPGALAAELRATLARTEEIRTDAREGLGGYAKALGYLVGVVELLASSLEQEARAATVHQCRKCGEFLSGIRVQMRIDRCAKCDGRRR